jgi:opacity protein-like surface antigen
MGGLNISSAEHKETDSQFVLGNPAASGTVTTMSFQQEWGGVLGPRLGLVVTPNTMAYVAGGWAFGKMGRIKGVDDAGKVVDAFDHQETNLSGFFGEVGMETRLWSNVYGKVAGRYTSYGSIDLENVSDANSAQKTTLQRDSLDVMAGVTVKFGGGLFGN